VVHTTQPTTQNKEHLKKHQHHDPPRPLASSNFKLIGECDRLMFHGGARSLKHGGAIFLSEINTFFIL
jgi:hypothetical protein